jgi:hypothetical protein
MSIESDKIWRSEWLEMGLMLQEIHNEVHPGEPIGKEFMDALEDLKKQVEEDKLN